MGVVACDCCGRGRTERGRDIVAGGWTMWKRSRLDSGDNRALSPCRGGLNQFLDVKTKAADLEAVRSESSMLLFSKMNAKIGKRAHYQADKPGCIGSSDDFA